MKPKYKGRGSGSVGEREDKERKKERREVLKE